MKALELPQQGSDVAIFRLDDVDKRAHRPEAFDHLAIGRARPILVVERLRQGFEGCSIDMRPSSLASPRHSAEPQRPALTWIKPGSGIDHSLHRALLDSCELAPSRSSVMTLSRRRCCTRRAAASEPGHIASLLVRACASTVG